MATITPVATGTAVGVAVSYVSAAGGGDSIASASGAILKVRNGGSSITLTLVGAVNCSQGHLHDEVITCGVGDTEIEIPAHCVHADTGACSVTYSSVTSVTIAAVKP